MRDDVVCRSKRGAGDQVHSDTRDVYKRLSRWDSREIQREFTVDGKQVRLDPSPGGIRAR